MPLPEYVRRAIVPPVLATLPAAAIAVGFRLLHIRGSRPAMAALVLIGAAVTIPSVWRVCLTQLQRGRLKAKLLSFFLNARRSRQASLTEDATA
jgi:hypothetical protein